MTDIHDEEEIFHDDEEEVFYEEGDEEFYEEGDEEFYEELDVDEAYYQQYDPDSWDGDVNWYAFSTKEEEAFDDWLREISYDEW